MAMWQQVRLRCQLSLIVLFFTVVSLPELWAQEQSMSADDLIDLPLEALMQMDTTVVSASKRDETLKNSPAAIYVIGKEDLRRAAISNIPDALRMVPGMQVAKVSSNEWAVSARGLGGRYARYLLVLIDGRSIYTSLFSGVNWDEQNISLEDIERIEVVRGPGGSLWGANAVNGIVNIITRKPEALAGIQLRATVGDGEEKSSVYGRVDFATQANSEAFVSLYTQKNGALVAVNPNLKGHDWQSSRLNSGWQFQQAQNTLNISAGFFEVQSTTPWAKQLLEPPWAKPLYSHEDKKGFYGSLRWQHQTGYGQWYLLINSDDTQRDATAYHWSTRNYDAEWQWTGGVGQRQMLTAGLYSRYTESDFSVPADGSGIDVLLRPEKQSSKTHSIYFQDTLTLSPTVSASLGLRLDDHSLGHSSVQPSLRIMWQTHKSQRFWGAMSKANSTPSRILNSQSALSFATLPPDASAQPPASFLPVRLSLSNRDSNEVDVKLLSFELGYRYSASEVFSLDAVFFEHRYENILGVEGTGDPEFRMSYSGQGYLHIPIYANAQGVRENQGFELALAYQPCDQWFLQYSATILDVEQGFEQSDDSLGFNLAETVPQQQHILRSLWRVNKQLDLDTIVRYVGALEKTNIPSYASADIKLAYTINTQLSISLNARNLFNSDKQYIESEREIFNAGAFTVEPYAYLKIEWDLTRD
ncbi:TonB-dependent receptor plug domain-containing protein [Marinagarivorans algicola]|uniref:TonB-dependent receptor plug domain-containing protein n=1 Tax=Marinagarivorans algicola TaxID=1513270 RepID=UPI003734E3DE